MGETRRGPWMSRPEMDRLVRRGLLPADVDRVNVAADGGRVTVYAGPDGHQEVVLRAVSDPFRESPGGGFWWAPLELALRQVVWQ